MPFKCNYTSCCHEIDDKELLAKVGTPNDLIPLIRNGHCPRCGRDADLQGFDFSKFEKKEEPKKVIPKKKTTKTTKKKGAK